MPSTGKASGANTSMSGALAPSRHAANAKRERCFSPIWPSNAPAKVWVILSIVDPRHCERSEAIQGSAGLPRRLRLLAMTVVKRALELVRLLFDLPGLALGDERLEVGSLALGGGRVLL